MDVNEGLALGVLPPTSPVSGPIPTIMRLAHTAFDGTVESFANAFDNLSEHFGKREERFREPLRGKVAIVTGGNAGIGFATAQQLARRGAHVILACRDPIRAHAAVQAIAHTPPLPGCCCLPSSPSCPSSPSPLRVEAMHLDLGRLSSVRHFAEEWGARGLPLHLLVCNAGVMGPPKRLETADGLEMQFQVNFLSHWLLANELLSRERNRRMMAAEGAAEGAAAAGGSHGPVELPPSEHPTAPPSSKLPKALFGARRQRDAVQVAASAASPAWASHGGCCGGPAAVGAAEGSAGEGNGSCEGTRVVMVTSLTHRAGALQWGDKQSRSSYEPFVSYALSKLANVMTAKELQRRFDRSAPVYGKDTAVAVHPGLVSTDLANGFFAARSTGWAAGSPLQPLVEGAVRGVSSVVGPLLMRSAAQSADVMLHACLAPPAAVAGRYLALGRPAQPDQAAEDTAMAEELWRYAEQLTGCTPHPSLR